jgi:hypothetical protein
LRKLKFRLKKGKGAVSGFTDSAGIPHLPGDIVDLPASYKGEKWLEQIKEEEKPVAAPSRIEPAAEASVAEPGVPFEEKKPSKKRR